MVVIKLGGCLTGDNLLSEVVDLLRDLVSEDCCLTRDNLYLRSSSYSDSRCARQRIILSGRI